MITKPEKTTFPDFYLREGDGLHKYLFHYACKCAEFELNEDLVIEHMIECVEDLSYHRDVPDREIESAVNDAYATVNGEITFERKKVQRYEKYAALEISRSYPTTIDELKEASPLPIPNSPKDSLSQLFDRDELVCMGIRLNNVTVLPMDIWLDYMGDIEKYQFLVPHPMSTAKGLTKSGYPSPRTVSNTGRRRRIVCDFDKPAKEIQPSLIVHLSNYCGKDPELILTSGGKSLHSWWRIDDWSDDEIEIFEEEATRVGADPALLGEARKNQLVRFPGAIRDNGNKQSLLYWNPTPINK
jgi:hypothetical protein